MELDSQKKILLKVAIQDLKEKIEADAKAFSHDYTNKWSDYKDKQYMDKLANRDHLDQLLNHINANEGQFTWSNET